MDSKTNLEEGRLGIDSDNYGVFIWYAWTYFYDYCRLGGGVTEKEYLDGVHEFLL